MANVDNPHGLRPLMRTIDGGEISLEEFDKDVNEAAAIFIFDLVNRETDGNIEANGATPATTLFNGVSLNYGAAATATKHQVIVNPGAIYEAQDNADTEGFVTADQGLNANIELNAGSATTLISGHEVDESTWDVTASLDLKLLKLHPIPGNAYGPNARIQVMINKHRMNPVAVGV